MKRLMKLIHDKDFQNKPIIGYIVLVALYLLTSRITREFSNAPGAVEIAGQVMPMEALAGVFASIANSCVIFLVVFYDRVGFLTGAVIFIIRFFRLLKFIFVIHTMPSIAGIFTGLVTVLAIFLIYRRNRKIEKLQDAEIARLVEQQKFSTRLFEQTATALVSAIDAKDEYSRGHSQRVAEYSELLAKHMGKSEDECRKIYYAGLLHDVGKIGIDDGIIKKKGRPTQEEYRIIEQHPIIGNQILSSISEYPYLSIGAHYHHERFDGKGYPDRLKGYDIPEIARIIAVADTYDAMTSSRSYRDALPQQLAWEEIVKGSGTQFDPDIAKLAHFMTNIEAEYRTMEKKCVAELSDSNGIHYDEFRGVISSGILVSSYETRIHLRYSPDEGVPDDEQCPAFVLFDAFDGRFHDEEKLMEELGYNEYCEVRLCGRVTGDGIRKVQTKVVDKAVPDYKKTVAMNIRDKSYDVVAVKKNDHVLIRIDDGFKDIEIIIALPDSIRFVYMGLTGEHCYIRDVRIEKSENEVSDNYIPRIAEVINYIDGPEGDIPSVQMLNHRTAYTVGVPIKDGLKLSFHAKSLPTARLIWHCAYILFFYSKDGKVYGEDYIEYGLVRFDGEFFEGIPGVENKMLVNMNDSFEGWDEWKIKNKAGVDCEAFFKVNGDNIVLTTENQGLFIKNSMVIKDNPGTIYAAITGDEVVITDIRIG